MQVEKVFKMYCTQLGGCMGLKCASERACAQELQLKCRKARETYPNNL